MEGGRRGVTSYPAIAKRVLKGAFEGEFPSPSDFSREKLHFEISKIFEERLDSTAGCF